MQATLDRFGELEKTRLIVRHRTWWFGTNSSVSVMCAGIPKFYRWLSERYPCVNQPISETHVPIIDNLYLDMNGIIHNCTHGNDPGVRLKEEQMVEKIFLYLERLMSIVQPQKLLFMAIDGTYLLSMGVFRFISTHLREDSIIK
jgi:XRN 5'-3' exonuclease N-terminus